MYSEDDLLPLSALQHFIFCQRQCALIHLEQAWVENRFTAEGRVMHENAHEQGMENRKDVHIERGIPLRSFTLGLTGKADVVEFHKQDSVWLPFPVEYKRGKPKANDCDKVQLCAQALCLEEMLKVKISVGALFYGKTKHRLDVPIDDGLRQETIEMAERLHAFIAQGKTPKAEYEEKCEACSFLDICLPATAGSSLSVEKYLKNETEGL
jgi:CRISPR-associated exonuclease Cas4